MTDQQAYELVIILTEVQEGAINLREAFTKIAELFEEKDISEMMPSIDE